MGLAMVMRPGCAPTLAQQQPIPLIASFDCEPDAANPSRLTDSGPLKIHGKLDRPAFVAGKQGQAIHLDNNSKALLDGSIIQKLGTNFSFTFWLLLDSAPQGRTAFILQKGGNQGFQLGISPQRALYYHGNWGGGWYDAGAWGGAVPLNQWTHVAWTFEKGGKGRIYINGQQTGASDTPFAFYPENTPLEFGGEAWSGALDNLRIYAAALTPDQVRTDMAGTDLGIRPAAAGDLPPFPYPIRMSLARFDMPIGFQPYDQRHFQTATRVPGPDATDWPRLYLDGKTPLFEGETAASIGEVPLLPDGQAHSLFRQPFDHEITPVHHWLRANGWLWGRRFVYTTDRTARTSSGDYEIWGFPVELRGSGDRDIQSVKLTLGGETIYQRKESLHSLTFILPANLNGAPYELWVNDRGPVHFDVGLQPVTPGHPDDVPLPVNAVIPGDGPSITVHLATHPPAFPNQKEWDSEAKSMAAPIPQRPVWQSGEGTHKHLGIDTPRSPVAVFTASMRGGMSGGHLFNPSHITGFKGTPEEYAAFLAQIGYDWVFEDAVPGTLDARDFPLERWASAMNAQGLKFGLNPEIPGNLGILSNPNLAFQSSFLPEWGKPAYRDAQLVTQRFASFPNFLGLMIGADNAGYVTYWDWAPTIPDRPWGRAYEQFLNGHAMKTPVGPAIAPSQSWETAGTEKEFLDYIQRYDQTFTRYGYFTRAVSEAAPHAVLCSGSYGSNPGVGGRGGWPWATIPGRPMLANLPVQVAYDWNELSSSMPLHNVALLDRMRSYFPSKPTWALVDDFGLFFGREARQRAYALALTRGVEAIGTTFLAHTSAGNESQVVSGQTRSRATIVAEQQELYRWIRQYGSVYRDTQLLPQVGVLYVHEQAISRPIVGGDNPDSNQLYHGSHEGKTNEALFLCHMAGFPAKIITPEELKRGLPPSMQAVLLTGLNRFDKTWAWWEGIESDLKQFTARGGKFLLDDESIVPEGVAAISTGMRIAAYVSQSDTDTSPLLLARNRDNAAKLEEALKDLQHSIAWSSDPTIWAIPHQTGAMQYVTVVNWANEPGQNASLVVRGQKGKLTWNTNRPIYDLARGRMITPEEAKTVDLTHDAVRVYALPPAPVGTIALHVGLASNDHFIATVTLQPNISGAPVEVTVKRGDDEASVFGASGSPIKLPLTSREAGTWNVTAKELLSGQTTNSIVLIAAAPKPPVTDNATSQVAAFIARKAPLVIALTPEQSGEPQIVDLARKLQAYFGAHGRQAQIRSAAPNDIILSLQPWSPQQRYPQWKTVDADLVLLGSPADNILLLDQARGYLLPDGVSTLEAGQFKTAVTYSPFVGEQWALNLLAKDTAGLEAAVRSITGN